MVVLARLATSEFITRGTPSSLLCTWSMVLGTITRHFVLWYSGTSYFGTLVLWYLGTQHSRYFCTLPPPIPSSYFLLLSSCFSFVVLGTLVLWYSVLCPPRVRHRVHEVHQNGHIALKVILADVVDIVTGNVN